MPLTDAQWARIEPLLPDKTPKWGGRWRDHREVIDAIAWKLQTGSQWVHLPERYGNWRGVYNPLKAQRSALNAAQQRPRSEHSSSEGDGPVFVPKRGHSGLPRAGRPERPAVAEACAWCPVAGRRSASPTTSGGPLRRGTVRHSTAASEVLVLLQY
ncbi:transposase [Streptomyces tubercidicus]|uniref:transposase n=1 Tax=Streptomyces tubercidicus TaxID=47759 RepID=UPI0037584B43